MGLYIHGSGAPSRGLCSYGPKQLWLRGTLKRIRRSYGKQEVEHVSKNRGKRSAKAMRDIFIYSVFMIFFTANTAVDMYNDSRFFFADSLMG